jgi:hypothetical protein
VKGVPGGVHGGRETVFPGFFLVLTDVDIRIIEAS